MRASRRPLPGRMSILSVRQSLQGISRALANRKATVAEKIILIQHQATLMNELREIEKARRQQRPKTQPEA